MQKTREIEVAGSWAGFEGAHRRSMTEADIDEGDVAQPESPSAMSREARS
jgi:hypothetical protein